MFEFEWARADDGYEAAVAKDVGKRNAKSEVFIVAKEREGPAREHFYRPLEDPAYNALFLNLALTLPEQDTIAAFASRYGLLGVNAPYLVWVRVEGEKKGCFGESLSSWEQSIGALRRAVDVWKALENGDIPSLKNWFVWDGPDVVKFIHEPIQWMDLRQKEKSPKHDSHRAALARLQLGDFEGAADLFLAVWISDALENAFDAIAGAERDKRQLSLKPHSLLSALWLQFARARDGDTADYLKCPQCGTWFGRTPGEKGKGKQYCSNACKSKAYRVRRERAIELATGGLSPREVAKKLSTDAKTVRGWLKKEAKS